MGKFEEFLNAEDTQERIRQLAVYFEGFIQEFDILQVKDVEVRITAWLGNFASFDKIDYSILLRLLEGVHYYSDNTVDQKFRPALAAFNLAVFKHNDLKNLYLCPLGNETESSFRISSRYNENSVPYLTTDINKLLNKIKDNEEAVVVFVDDILQSGGQLNSIFRKYLGIRLKDGETSDEYKGRVGIDSEELKAAFKKKKIVLFFYLVFFQGYEKISKDLKDELGLDVQIKPLDDVVYKGCFGSEGDIRKLEGGSAQCYVAGPFKGIQYRQVKGVYDILKEAGVKLLESDRVEKEKGLAEDKKWSKNTYAGRALGYGNDAMLLVGNQNVPTSTVTALWLPIPENKTKAINIQGKEIYWEPLFYRKPKILPEGSQKQEPRSEVYPMILVNKINPGANQVDVYSYDLLTLLVLSRGNNIWVYGHEPDYPLPVDSRMLNDLESGAYGHFKSLPGFQKREWLACTVTKNTILADISDLVKMDIEMSGKEIGLLIKLASELTPAEITPIGIALQDLRKSKKNGSMAILIDCPTRNHELLKQICDSSGSGQASDILVSCHLSAKKIETVESNSFVFDQKNNYAHVFAYLEELAQNPFAEEIRITLKSLEMVKHEIRISGVRAEIFSPTGLIDNFTAILVSPESDKEAWRTLFEDLLVVCGKYTPSYIDYFLYHSAQSKVDFIRFSSLKYAIRNNNIQLIDYWISGTGCQKEFFENISGFICPVIGDLMYPMLRYYNSNPGVPGLNTRVLEIIEALDGKNLVDYWLAQRILSDEHTKYTRVLLTKHGITISKLIESGINLFEEVETLLLKGGLISADRMDKLLLCTRMTTDKLKVIRENHTYLIS